MQQDQGQPDRTAGLDTLNRAAYPAATSAAAPENPPGNLSACRVSEDEMRSIFC